ncbi:MAG TPA: class I SAM-dependent methyltransferase, partial [Nitrospirota bacterium]|nr:class I SAM-dependent methyltransferase [Nitrospirota bacterium]
MLKLMMNPNLRIEEKLEPRFEILFQNRIDYKDEPSKLDAAQNTANELALYHESKRTVQKLFQKSKEPLLVVDFCAGTGLFSEHILEVANVGKVVCVDTDDQFLDASRQRLTKHANIEFEFRNEDATTFRYPEKVDLILMGSAYHHVLNEEKVQFLKNAKELLKPDGHILVNENFLPPYSNSLESYREAVYLFYSELIKYLEKMGTPDNAVDIIRQVAWYGYQYDYEYKVSYNVFHDHVKKAGLKISRKIRVWPHKYPNAF